MDIGLLIKDAGASALNLDSCYPMIPTLEIDNHMNYVCRSEFFDQVFVLAGVGVIILAFFLFFVARGVDEDFGGRRE